MRRSIATIILIAAAALLAASGVIWNALRNAHPAIRETPSESIGPTEHVPPTAAPQPSPRATNTTGMPLRLPAGFSISIFARNLGSPRVMTWDPAGNLLVSITASGKVVALPDVNADGVADRIVPVAEGLNRPHGLAFRCETPETCALYIAETNQLAVYDYDATTLRAFNRRTLADLPSGGGHFTRTLIFLPHPNEDLLLISVGSSCNACEETDWRRAKILSYNVKTGELKGFARGLRNAVFMNLHPVTGEVWATEMGRDWLGDDLPPDEINIIGEGRDYGWPICYGKNIHDAEFDKKVYARDPCADKTPSFIDIPAHSAPLGLAFFPEEGWPEEYWHDLLVAYHGSWNRSVPTGYKIVRYHLDSRGNYLGEEDFITGWLTPAGAVGRPVDILIQPGGKLYISDDRAGLIYKVAYNPPPIDTSNLIKITAPKPNDIVKSPLLITGEARGNWYFEASFPVKLIDANGDLIVQGHAEALSDWMTTDFVAFKATLEFEKPATPTGTLVLEKDNPSGLPENAAEVRIPVRF